MTLGRMSMHLELEVPPVQPGGGAPALLMESGSYILMEDGSHVLLE